MKADNAMPFPSGNLGVYDGEINDGFKAQNPVAEKLTIFIPNKVVTIEGFLLRVFNVDGELLFSSTLQPNGHELDLPIDWLNPGAYFVQLKNELKTEIFKIIKH